MIHILYVDEETELVETCKSYLEQNDCTVVTASSAPGAIEVLQSNAIQVVVSGYHLPGTNGIKLLRIIRETNKTIPFILFTGRGSEEIAIKAFECGADFYQMKGGAPAYQFANLLEKIRAAVARRDADTQIITFKRLYSVLSETNKAIACVKTKMELLDEICQIDVDSGGLAMVWAGIVNYENHLIRPVACSHDREGSPGPIPISIDTQHQERGPTETAFHTKSCFVCNDIARDQSRASWRKDALERGCHSIAAIPFGLNTKTPGVMTFSSYQKDFFNDQIIQFLDEQSRDISFAFEHLDREEQRISAENELRKSELKYRRLFQTAQDAILILDGETGEIIDANTFILDMLGYPLDYLVGRQLWELGFVKDKSFIQKAFRQLKSEGYIRYEHLPLETNMGRAISVEFISNLYLVDDKKIIQCNIRDITERKRAEDALTLTRRKLNLMSGITRHDIMNQLTVLLGSLTLARESMKEPEEIAHIKRAQKAADTILRQIAFTKEYEDIGVREPVWQRLSLMIPSAASQMVSSTIAIEKPEDNLEIYADPMLIKVFYNLFENARQYGGTVTQIRVSHHQTDSGLVITVADNGCGISPEDKKHLFERGYGKNTGLGLFLSREILSITGISINETSLQGMGARFEIAVPEGAFRFRKNL